MRVARAEALPASVSRLPLREGGWGGWTLPARGRAEWAGGLRVRAVDPLGPPGSWTRAGQVRPPSHRGWPQPLPPLIPPCPFPVLPRRPSRPPPPASTALPRPSPREGCFGGGGGAKVRLRRAHELRHRRV